MSLFSRRKNHQSTQSCTHEVLDARWDAMSDVGHEECVDHYVCRRCEIRIPADDRTQDDDAA